MIAWNAGEFSLFTIASIGQKKRIAYGLVQIKSSVLSKISSKKRGS